MSGSRIAVARAVLTAALLPAALLAPAPAQAEIAFAGLTDGYWQIWVMADDGSGRRQVTFEPQDKRLPLWVDRDRLIYETNRGQLRLLDLRDGAVRPLFEAAGNFNGCDVEGKRVACARFRHDARDLSEIVVGDLDAGGPRTVTRRTALYRSPRWLPGGETLAFSTRDGPGPEGLARVQIANSAEQPLLRERFEAVFPDISPDGRQLAFASNESGNYDVWILDLTTGGRRKLTDAPGLDTQPRWMNGQLLFVSSRGGKSGVWKMRADGTAPTPMTDFPSKDPDWVEGRQP